MKKILKRFALAVLVALFAWAVKYGEDGQVGTSNDVSKILFVLALAIVGYALGDCIRLFLRKRK